MKFYRVTEGILRTGAGQAIGISALQYRARAHNLEVVPVSASDKDSLIVLAKPIRPVEFKVGEVLGLADIVRIQETVTSEITRDEVLADIRDRAEKHGKALAKLKTEARARAAAGQMPKVKAA